MFKLFSIRSTWNFQFWENFQIFFDFQKVDLRKCRPIEKNAMYEAENFQKVVSKQKTNLQKVSVVYVKRVKIRREKTTGGGVKNAPP